MQTKHLEHVKILQKIITVATQQATRTNFRIWRHPTKTEQISQKPKEIRKSFLD